MREPVIRVPSLMAKCCCSPTNVLLRLPCASFPLIQSGLLRQPLLCQADSESGISTAIHVPYRLLLLLQQPSMLQPLPIFRFSLCACAVASLFLSHVHESSESEIWSPFPSLLLFLLLLLLLLTEGREEANGETRRST